jgi:hypothetical protein
MQGGLPKDINATLSSETLVGWKTGKTTYVPLYGNEWREPGYGLSTVHRPCLRGKIMSRKGTLCSCVSVARGQNRTSLSLKQLVPI